MMAAKLLEKSVVVRELMPQDLKVEVSQLSRTEAMNLARYLAGVVGSVQIFRTFDQATASVCGTCG